MFPAVPLFAQQEGDLLQVRAGVYVPAGLTLRGAYTFQGALTFQGVGSYSALQTFAAGVTVSSGTTAVQAITCTTLTASSGITCTTAIIGTDPGGSELLRVGGGGRFSGLLTCAGGVSFNGDNLSKSSFYGRYSAGDPTFYVSNGASVACAIALQTYDGTTTRDALRLTAGGGAIFANSITHGSATLLTTSVALTNGAAAAAGTLTNAPAAGNPTKWIPINDNGTTRYIPAW